MIVGIVRVSGRLAKRVRLSQNVIVGVVSKRSHAAARVGLAQVFSCWVRLLAGLAKSRLESVFFQRGSSAHFSTSLQFFGHANLRRPAWIIYEDTQIINTNAFWIEMKGD
jgi:hypothetical protein